MARGNQRDKAREKNLKAAAGAKTKNTQSGTEFARSKEAAAEIMRAKQAAVLDHEDFVMLTDSREAEAKKAEAAAAGKK